MAQPTLAGITLEGCERIQISESANIVPLPMPTEDSSETELFDMLGVIRIITVDGRLGGSTVGAVTATVDPLFALANGDQTIIVFSSDQTGDINVMVAGIDIIWDVPGFSCTYNIKLFRGV